MRKDITAVEQAILGELSRFARPATVDDVHVKLRPRWARATISSSMGNLFVKKLVRRVGARSGTQFFELTEENNA